MENLAILMLGRSGSGKGTQSDLLKEKLNFDFHITTGSIFREMAKEDTFVGRKIKKIIDDGSLAPAWIPSFVWKRILIENIQTGNESIVFDGVARRIEEAKHLDEVMEWFDKKIIPIHLNITEEEAIRRLKGRGREDDNDENIKNRMNWFESEVAEVLNYYKDSNRLIEVDGMPSIKEVHQNIVKALNL